MVVPKEISWVPNISATPLGFATASLYVVAMEATVAARAVTIGHEVEAEATVSMLVAILKLLQPVCQIMSIKVQYSTNIECALWLRFGICRSPSLRSLRCSNGRCLLRIRYRRHSPSGKNRGELNSLSDGELASAPAFFLLTR